MTPKATLKCPECSEDKTSSADIRCIQTEWKCSECLIKETNKQDSGYPKVCARCLKKTHPLNTYKVDGKHYCNECSLCVEAIKNFRTRIKPHWERSGDHTALTAKDIRERTPFNEMEAQAVIDENRRKIGKRIGLRT